MDIRRQLLAAFEAEHREHVDAIRSALSSSAEGQPTDWNDVFRRAHSLKGAARAVDLPPVEAIAHRLESLFEAVKGGRPVDRPVLAAVQLALDRIEECVAGLEHAAPTTVDDALDALDGCLAPALAEHGDAGPLHESKTKPKPGSLAPEPASARLEPAQNEAAVETGATVLRVPAAVVEALTRETHALANALAGHAALDGGLNGIASAANDLRRRLEAIKPAGDEAAALGSFGEIEARLSGLAREAFALARRHRLGMLAVENATARVRDEAERLTLIPADTAFGGFARALREMARAQGGEIDVRVRGLDLPVDRAMLQSLRDPVLHALRNALGHGAEPVEARLRAGKPATLGILFCVEALGSRLIIGIHDDGRGPDLAAIETRARALGLLRHDERADAHRLLALVFEPGFSTAAGLDTLSGRGIGLSVVAEAVRALQGSVRLETRAPFGASLVMSLPLSAARRPVLIVEAGGARYALPSAAVERVLRLGPDEVDTLAGRPVARIEAGDLTATGATSTVPVVMLADLIGAEPVGPAEAVETGAHAILVASGSDRCLLLVERLSEVRTLLVLPAPPIGADRNLIAGTVIIGSDTPVLVLDAEGLIDRAREGASRPRQFGRKGYEAADGTMPRKRRSTILVVDDSITTRTLEKSILEAAGYRVVACVDGQDALDRLRSGIEPVDLVVADVEMPHLDGFGLVKALRAEEAFATLPVILMTSRGAQEDVARGMELGADAYLTKQRFDQRELLDSIEQLL